MIPKGFLVIGVLVYLLTISDSLMPHFLSTIIVCTAQDSVTVSVDAVVYYRVSNATVSVANVENAHHSTRLYLYVKSYF